MHLKSEVIFVFFLFTISIFCNAQESIGLKYGQYNGVSASSLNPSYLNKTHSKWRFRLGGVHIFASTNYGHIHNTNTINLLSNANEVNVSDIPYDDVITPQNLDVVFKTQNTDSYFDIKGEILGPGITYRLNDKTIIGVNTKGRLFASGKSIPSSLNYYNITELQSDSIFVASQFQVNAMTWMQYGVALGHLFNDNFSFGVNVNYMRGYDAAGIDNNLSVNYIERGDTLTSLDPGQTRLVFSDLDDDVNRPNGTGFTTDIGINIKNENGSYIGFSIIDLGYLKTSGKNHLISFQENQSVIYPDYDHVNSSEDLISQLDEDGFTIDSTASFTMLAPTALSIQFENPISEHWQIQGHWVQRLQLNDIQVQRANSLTVAGVFEKKHLSVFIPVTLYNYNKLRMGLAFRLGFLTIGSDNITSFIGKKDFDGTDFYINATVYPFNIKGNKKGKDINCYGF